ncbi:serine/threonine-protein kinase [Paenibacillus sp. ACRRX]|uniref:serine/threonine-protein kinase n=1 Tax=Paenibacillus sp. ACRRX TaxID=2918206 RepID=UPI001EF6F18A|nr:serine/threonine-protein kinase [Paenibacillus sp. ACRRX]
MGLFEMKDIIVKYEELGSLGSGNFGSVFKAHNKIVDRIEAVKIVHDISKLGDKANLEARVQHKLEHTNVSEIYDAFIKNDKLYILMEYLQGGSIFKLIEDNGKLPIKQSIRIIIDALHGLQYIHNQNYIHRDIKPSNLLLDKSGNAKLSDFGLTAELDDSGKYTSSFGYVYHKAPEVLTKGEYTKKADIFAIGLTLYRMVNGDGFISMFDRSTLGYNIVSGDFPPRDLYSPDVPKKLRMIINKSLEIDPEKRYQNAHSIRSELNNINIPIDWQLSINTSRKQVWEGNDSTSNYSIEVNKNLFGNSYNIKTKKGKNNLRVVNKHCFEGLSSKQLNKELHKLLTIKL